MQQQAYKLYCQQLYKFYCQIAWLNYLSSVLCHLSSESAGPINGNHTTEFAYDAVGNRLQQTKDGTTTTYVYNTNDQIQSETQGAQVTSYTYDNNGNTLTKSINNTLNTSYSYNKANRMVQVITPTSTITNTYDASGIRQSQTVDGTTTNYLIDQNRAYAQVLEEQNNLFIPQITYVYGDDLINQTQSGITHILGYDGLGSTRILTDTAGTVQNAYGYQAFGELDYQLGTVENKYLFTGEQYDNNVGFYYLRARFYNPSNGRFTQMDTFAGMGFEPKTLHKYLYANVNPVSFVDPSGKFSVGAFMVGLALGATINAYADGISNGIKLLNRLNFVNDKDATAYIDFSSFYVPRFDNAYLKNFILNQVRKYYKPFGIKIKTGKGSMLSRRVVFRAGLTGGFLEGRTLVFFSRVWAEGIAYLYHSKTPISKIGMAIANVVTHEIGHGLGMSHDSNLCWGFIMDDGACEYEDTEYDSKSKPFSVKSQQYLNSRKKN